MESRKKSSLVGKLILFFNIIAVFLLLLAYLSFHISPAFFWPIAFAGLVYPFILLLNGGFILIWLIRRKYYFLISLIAILLGFNHVRSFIQISSLKRELPQTGVNLHVLSYNVRVFDLYNYVPKWQHNYNQRNNIFRFLEEKDFDIICFQEFVHEKTGRFKTVDTLVTFLRAKYAHTYCTRDTKGANLCGIATFTAYPIVNKGTISFSGRTGNVCIYTDILAEKDTIRIYNAHFESIGLSPEDLMFVEKIVSVENIPDRDAIRSGSTRILRRIKNAFQQRAGQVELVAEHIKNCPYPVILAADFNDTPVSYAYKKITALIDDAFLSGRGIGQTYIGNLPGFRIDYIMHSNDFIPFNFVTGNQKYSDHYPVSVWFNYSGEK